MTRNRTITNPTEEPDESSVESSYQELDITILLPSLHGSGLREILRKWLNRLLGLPKLNQLFENAKNEPEPFVSILERLETKPDSGDLTNRIPKSGACIVVANHPNGGTDSLTLAGACMHTRHDTLALANSYLTRLPGVGKWLIPLNTMGQKGATRRNQTSMKAALAHLQRGGLLLVFPAGTISHWRGDLGRIADPEWSEHIARLARRAKAPVLPVRIFDKNPLWFELLGMIHPMIQLALIPRLLLASHGKRLLCRAGKVVECSELADCISAKEATAVMRRAVQAIRPE